MSKIIVDEIQANGGDTLTIPSTDATANNQPIVGSTAGALTFSPLALPSADGDANKPLTTDGSAQLQFGAFALPATAGTDGQVLTSTGTAAAWEGVTVAALPSAENANVIGTMWSSSGQAQSYSTGDWSSSGPYTTYRHDNFFTNANDYNQGFNMLLGDGYPNGTTQITYVHNMHYDQDRQLQFASGQRVGWQYKDWWSNDNNTSYGGLTWRLMPIRNTSGSSINVTVNALYSAYGSGYNGASLGYYTPTNSSGTTYSTVTGGTWTQLQTYNSSTVSGSWSNQTVPVPAGKTVLVVLNTSHAYQTTYRFIDNNLFYDVDTTFSDSNIICDLKLLYTLSMGASYNSTNSLAKPEDFYTLCATLFGDR